MTISYTTYAMRLRHKETHRDLQPLGFMLRSTLGSVLFELACIMPHKDCDHCALRTSCAYGLLFEGAIDPVNPVIPGQKRASQPFLLDIHTLSDRTSILELTAIGPAHQFATHMIRAIQRVGFQGLGRKRIRFDVEAVTQAGDVLNGRLPPVSRFTLEQATPLQGSVVIKLKTPLRIRTHGKYLRTLSWRHIRDTTIQRLKVLSHFYGESPITASDDSDLVVTDQDTHWASHVYYSARQKQRLTLAGLTGSLTLEGRWAPPALDLLKAAQIFRIGKNISFGLGQIEIAHQALTPTDPEGDQACAST